MDRKQFLQNMVRAGAMAAVSRSLMSANSIEAQVVGGGKSGQSPATNEAGEFRGKRAKTELSYEVSARPEAVFPLLCPVREYEWLDGWRCELIYTASGVAEDNCVFRTKFHGNPMVWSAVRYEPPRHIEYLAVSSPHIVMRLSIKLDPVGEKTLMRWTRTFTTLSDEGDQHLSDWTTELEKHLGEKLEHFLKTGQKLPTQST